MCRTVLVDATLPAFAEQWTCTVLMSAVCGWTVVCSRECTTQGDPLAMEMHVIDTSRVKREQPEMLTGSATLQAD